ncbi:aquIMA [Symbiodinium sp. CCMP2592]|nr:aquIMA [Symbiodinium sp. CCMP2592]
MAVFGDFALKDVPVGSTLDIVVFQVNGGIYKGAMHGDLYSCPNLGPGFWTLFGYTLSSVERNVGYLTCNEESRAFPKPDHSAAAFGTVVEVCAGIGGLGLGARFSGMHILLQVERTDIACETLRLNGGPVLAGDIGAPKVQYSIAKACQGQGHLLAASLSSHSLSLPGMEGGHPNWETHILGQILQVAWRNQVAGLLLECPPEVQDRPQALQLLQHFAARMHFKVQQVALELGDQWASRRNRWWFVMLPQELPDLHLPCWLPTPTPTLVSDVIAEWPLWPVEQEKELARSPEEVQWDSETVGGPESHCLDTQRQAPQALHSWGSELQACPCGCREAGFSEATLRAMGHRGFRVLGPFGVRLPHAGEVGFLNSLPASFLHPPASRAALCLVGQITAPLQSLWITAHVAAWAESTFTTGGTTDPSRLILDYKRYLLETRRDLWLVPSLQPASLLQLISGDSTFDLKVSGPTRVQALAQAEKDLHGPGFLIRIFEGNRKLQPNAFLHPDLPSGTYRLHEVHVKSACRSVPSSPASAPPTGTTDVTIWAGLLRLQAACAQPVFIVPPATATNWLRLAWLYDETDNGIDFQWPAACEAVFLPFLWDAHWSLLVLSFAGGSVPSASLFDGLAGHSLDAARSLLRFVCKVCNLSCPDVELPQLPLQTEPTSCGPMLLAFAAQAMQGFNDPFQVLYQDAVSFCNCMPPHSAKLWGQGGLSDAQQSSLKALLVERGVPETAVADRVQAAVQKLGAGIIAKSLSAENPWQALKAAGSAPNPLYRWVRPEELRVYAQKKASLQFGTAVGNAKARKQKPSRPLKQALSVDPLSLQLAAGSFVSAQNAPLAQLAFDEVVSQAQGVAFCTAQQMMPFIADYKPLSVDALALISTAPLPAESCAGAPISNIRFPAVFSPTQEAVLLSGSMLQLGDEQVQLSSADADMGEIDQLDTITGRISLYRDEAQLDWEVFAKAPVKSLLQHVPGLNLCRDKSCKGDCASFHPAVDERVEHMLLDVWARQFTKLEGGRTDALAAQVFQTLVRVPSSAAKHLQHVSVPGFYFEPRATTGFGPHPAYAVVWLPGHDRAQVVHLLRTCDKAIGLARLGSKFGLRVLDEHEQAVFQELRPQHTFVKVRIQARWKLHPLPHGTQRHALVQLLSKWKWPARPLQPCKGDSSGCAWEVGSAVDPPASIMQAGDSYVLIHKTKGVGPQARPEALCASNRTRRRILYDDPEIPAPSADPWAGGLDPWSLARPPPGLLPPSGAASSSAQPSAAASKITQVKSELQAGLETLVRKEVQTATAACAAPAADQDKRLLQLETGLKEVKLQNSKFEEWFATLGSQMQQQAQQVVEVQQAVTAQKAEIGSLRTEVSGSIIQAVTALRSDMSEQFTAQTASLEALLSKKHRSEPMRLGPFRFLQFLLWFSALAAPAQACSFSPFRRFGEASHPGPEPLVSFGTSNPSGLRGKEQHAADLGPGVWHFSETQLSAVGFTSSSRAIKALTGNMHRDVRIFAGAPAPLRPGSLSAGSWTGVLTMSDFPCRPVQLQWLHDSFHTGRVQAVQHVVHGTSVFTANVYGYPSGKTFVDARARTERLLETLTHELVLGRKGIRLISGDFNHWHDNLDQVQLWKQQGWIEVQDLAEQRWHRPLVPTCKGSTHRDFIFLSPEAAALCHDVRVIDVFAEHATVIAGMRLTGVHRPMSWPLPSEIPWQSVSVSAWQHACQPIPLQEPNSTRWLQSFARDFERSLNGFVKDSPGGQLPHRCHGRAQRLSPDHAAQVLPPKPARPGEESAHHDLLSLEVKRWFQQLRRLQSLDHALKAGNPSPSAVEYRLGLWRSIVASKGFHPTFADWWPLRPVRLAGSPTQFPPWLPDAATCHRLFLDFRDNFRKFEAWNIRQRRAILAEQYAQNRNLLFRDLRDPKPEQVDTLELRKCYCVLAVEPSTCLVHLDSIIDTRGCSQWQLDGCSVQVDSVVGDLCRIPGCENVDVDCELEQTILLSSAKDVQNEFEKLWSSYWGRFSDPAAVDWSRVTAFAQAFLPRSSLALPPIDLPQWRAAIKRFKPRAARGADGIARLDLLNMSDAHAQQLLQLFRDIELGIREWPAQWLIGLVCCLKKPNQLLPDTALGFMPHKEASQFWWILEAQIELACQQDQSMVGFSTDVVKAFNALPRQPVFALAEWIGLPTTLLQPWQAFLTGLERSFLLRQAGCALSTVAMSLVCLAFHAYVEAFASNAVPHSYVDNLSCTAQSTGQLAAGINVTHTFLDMLALSTDATKTYVWALQPAQRSMLSSVGLRVVDHARELGGNICFGRAVRNAEILQALPAKFWASALHGISGCPLAEVHLASLRTQAVRALRCCSAGSSPMLRLSTSGLLDADPGFYQLWSSLRDLRRLSVKDGRVIPLWADFVAGFQGSLLPGPFSKLLQVLSQIGWRLEPPPCVTDHEGFQHDLTTAPLPLLRQLCEQAWLNHVASLHRHRRTMHDLWGIDLPLLQADASRLSSLDKARLAALQSGAFMFGVSHAKFDESKDGLCSCCGVPDSPEHRVRSCPLYESARGPYAWVCAEWPSLPECLRTHLLPPCNPHLPALRQQLARLPDRSGQFASLRCTEGPQHVFCDGSCLFAPTPAFALAAWSSVNACTGELLSTGPVPGLQQTAPRAELWGTLWTDSAMVGKGIRGLLEGPSPGSDENPDLWQLLTELVVAYPVGWLLVQHVPSHLDPGLGVSPFEDWLIRWNGHADTLAGLTNINRALDLQAAHQMAYNWHLRHLEILRALRGIYFGIADITAKSGHTCPSEVDPEDTEFPLPPPVPALIDSFEDALSVSWRQQALHSCPDLPQQFMQQLCDFLLQQGQTGESLRRVSWLELVFVLHAHGGPRFPVRALTSGQWSNQADVPLGAPALTVDVQMSLLRKTLRRILVALRRDDMLVDGLSLLEFGVTFRIGGILISVGSSLLQAARNQLFQFCAGRKVCTVGDLARLP